MRIGLLTDVYRSGFSGVANHVYLLKSALQKLGQDVFVFAFEQGAHPTADPNVIYSKGIILAADYPFAFRESPRAAALLQQMDILHVHQPFASGMVAMRQQKVLRQRKIRPAPILFTCHTRYDLYSTAYLPFLSRSVSAAILRRYMRFFSGSLDLMIAPSVAVQNLLRSWKIQTKIEVIPNGIDLDCFAPPPGEERAALRRKLGLPERACQYLYAGRMAGEKNITFLLHSFAVCRQSDPSAVLVLVGGGPKIGEVRAQIQSLHLSSNVLLTGRVDYAAIPEYLRAADVFVTASKTEVHPLTLIEAAASGLPVIGLDVPGINNFVIGDQTGLLSVEDATQFAANMRFLGQNPAARQMMGQNGSAAARAYSSVENAQKILHQYEILLNEK